MYFTLFQINKDPSQQLKIVGRACKLSRDAAQYCPTGILWFLRLTCPYLPLTSVPGILFVKAARR